MLVLTRKLDQAIVIGEGDQATVVKVVEIRDGRVRLGILANDDVPIYRGEIYAGCVPDKPLPDHLL